MTCCLSVLANISFFLCLFACCVLVVVCEFVRVFTSVFVDFVVVVFVVVLLLLLLLLLPPLLLPLRPAPTADFGIVFPPCCSTTVRTAWTPWPSRTAFGRCCNPRVCARQAPPAPPSTARQAPQASLP